MTKKQFKVTPEIIQRNLALKRRISVEEERADRAVGDCIERAMELKSQSHEYERNLDYEKAADSCRRSISFLLKALISQRAEYDSLRDKESPRAKGLKKSLRKNEAYLYGAATKIAFLLMEKKIQKPLALKITDYLADAVDGYFDQVKLSEIYYKAKLNKIKRDPLDDDEQALVSLLKNHENNKVEVKESLGLSGIGDTISAFANSKGGSICYWTLRDRKN